MVHDQGGGGVAHFICAQPLSHIVRRRLMVIKPRRKLRVADVSDLEKNPVICWQHKHYLLLILLMGFIASSTMYGFPISLIFNHVLFPTTQKFVRALSAFLTSPSESELQQLLFGASNTRPSWRSFHGIRRHSY